MSHVHVHYTHSHSPNTTRLEVADNSTVMFRKCVLVHVKVDYRPRRTKKIGCQHFHAAQVAFLHKLLADG